MTKELTPIIIVYEDIEGRNIQLPVCSSIEEAEQFFKETIEESFTDATGITRDGEFYDVVIEVKLVKRT